MKFKLDPNGDSYDCEKCHCAHCGNLCYRTCLGHETCGEYSEDSPLKPYCALPIETKEKVSFT